MKKLFLLICSFLPALFVCAQTPSFQWADGFSGADKASFPEGNCVVTDASGNVYVTGHFNGTVDFDPGPGVLNVSVNAPDEDSFIMKLDPSGNLIWYKHIHGAGSISYSRGIALDPAGNCYITGYFTGTADFDSGPGSWVMTSISLSTVFVLKLDAAGNVVFGLTMPGTTSTDWATGNSIAADAAGNMYVTGGFTGTADFDPGVGNWPMTSPGGECLFIVKLDPVGNAVWVHKTQSVTSAVATNSLSLDATGNVYISGYFSGSADFNVGAGTYSMTAASGSGAENYVLKLDNGGNFLWAKKFGNGGAAYVKADGAGNVYAAGYFIDTADFDPGPAVMNLMSSSSYALSGYILKLDSSGNYTWASNPVGPSSEICALDVDGAGNVYVTGQFRGTVDFEPGAGTYSLTPVSPTYDIFIMKLMANNTFSWALNMGSPALDCRGHGISVYASQDVYTVGRFRGTVDFDPGAGVSSISAIGPFGLYVHKLGKDGVSGIAETTSNNGIVIYPVPATSSFTISGLTSAATITIYDASGRVIRSQQSTAATAEINLSNEAGGVYFVRVVNEQQAISKRIIKQ